jgi:DNA polymerase-3 subunit gamma/tau
MSESLYLKYRPRDFSEVVGQDAVVKTLAKELKRSHAFLFHGPSGTGKTTLARICAAKLGSKDENLIEVDAATYTGIDAMRQIQDILQYKPFGDGHRSVVLDEAHALSKNSWRSLLKSIEEPPPYVSWFFCTTEPSKVPNTIKTRCSAFTLSLLNEEDLTTLVENVAEAEGVELPDKVCRIVVREAQGSPRRALVNLSLCREAESHQQAAQILRSALSSDGMLDLCRILARGEGGMWNKALAAVNRLDGADPESVRVVVTNYISKVLRSSKSEKEVCYLLGILESFREPFPASDGLGPLLLAIGKCCYGED